MRISPRNFVFLLTVLFTTSTSLSQAIWIPSGVKVLRGARISVDNDATQPEPDQHEVSLTQWHFAIIRFHVDNTKSREKIEAVLKDLATKTGHPEIVNIPFVNGGFSYSSCYANAFAAMVPDKMICLSASGCGGLPSIDSETDTALIQMPTVYIAQTGDFYAKAMNMVFGEVRRYGARRCLAVQGGDHAFDKCDILFKPFQEQCIKLRIPEDWHPLKGPPKLRSIPLEQSWIGVRDIDWYSSGRKYPKIFPNAGYSGDLNNTVWLPNEYMARVWQAFMSTVPALAITAPSMSDDRWYQTATFGQTYSVSATCTAPEVEKVELYDGNALLKSFTSSPYTASITADVPGTHCFSARAYLKDGSVLVSPTRGIFNAEGPDLALSLGSTGSRRVAQGSTVDIVAYPRSWEGTIKSVQFFDNGSPVGTASSSPYSVKWTANGPGDHVLVAAVANDKNETVKSTAEVYTVFETPVASKIAANPKVAYVKPTHKVSFTASVRDQHDFSHSLQPSVSWSASGGGTIDASGQFTAGQTLGTYEITASAAGLQGKIKVHVSNAICIDFGPSFIQVDGFLNDAGQGYGPRSNGLSYGWVSVNNDGTLGNPSGPQHARVRAIHTDRYNWEDAGHLNMSEQMNVPWNKEWAHRAWQIEVPNGEYRVTLAAGDPAPAYDLAQLQSQTRTTQFIIKIKAEGELIIDDTAFLDKPILVKTRVVAVSDGKLTLQSAYPNFKDADCPKDSKSVPALECRQKMNKVAYVEIVPNGELMGASRLERLHVNTPGIRLTKNRLVLVGADGLSVKIAILDLRGRVIRQIKRNGLDKGAISLGPLDAGIYLLHASVGGSTIKESFTILH